MRLYFSTLFDIKYLSRGLALYQSIRRHHENFVLYIVCVDGSVYNYFNERSLSHVQLITLNEIEERFDELRQVKPLRSPIDYIFTLSPYYPSYILQKNPDIPFICSLDCDQYYFANSEVIFDDLKKYSILIMPHKFSKPLIQKESVYGKFNVSFQVFKNDTAGNNCLALWRSQCFEWCYDVVEGERFADQKYLDTWATHFENQIKVIDHIGMGLAPWNLANYRISIQKRQVYVDDKILILYHYQGLRIIFRRLVNSGLSSWQATPSSTFVRHVLQQVVNAIFQYQGLAETDSIDRDEVIKKKWLFNNITSYSMFYRMGGLLINLDIFYICNKIQLKLHGYYYRFRDLFR